MTPKIEYIEVVDREGNVLKLAPRHEVHGNPDLLHRVVHVLVLDSGGRFLLQKRSMSKDVAPGCWDTSVGGHVDPGETPEQAACREMKEELGIEGELEFLYSYVHSNPYETELVYTYRTVHDGDGGGFAFNAQEIDEVRFFDVRELAARTGGAELSDNFKHELATYLAKMNPACLPA